MKFKYLLPVVLVLTIFASKNALASKINPSTTSNSEPVVIAQELDYMKLLTNKENRMISPMSLDMAMGMLANGYKKEDTTLKQFLLVQDSKSIEEYNKRMNNIINKYKQDDTIIDEYQDDTIIDEYNVEPVLEFANRLWYFNQDRVIKYNYSKTITSMYNANVTYAARPTAHEKINSWVTETTHDKIQSIVTKEKIADNPRLESILANVLYFKGSWVKEFSEAATKKEAFTNIDNTKILVDMMNTQTKFNYSKNSNFEIIELKYLMSDISMFIILPKDNTYDLVSKDLDASILTVENRIVNLKLPKFKTEFSIDDEILTYLEELGVDLFDNVRLTEIFSPNEKDEKFKTTAVVHKTTIEVDEKGTEASAITFIDMVALGAPTLKEEKVVNLVINKPFYYVIRDTKLGEDLFVGRQTTFK